MTLFDRRPRLRWLAPLVAVLLLGTAGSIVAALSASARDSLPPRSAAQLLVDVQKARLEGLSGTVVQTADLGLPALPGPAGDSSSSFTSLVSGSHTLRLWYAGPEQARVALLGQLGESDAIRNGSDVWLWSSHDNTATHLSVPAGATDGHEQGAADPAMTPQKAANLALDAITPSTRVTTDPTAVVADRSAYQLVLEPRDPSTLVGSVVIAIDGETHIPMRVQVFARGASKPSFEVGFTSFNPTTPPPSTFEFNPPPGATVNEGLGGPGDDSGGIAANGPEGTAGNPLTDHGRSSGDEVDQPVVSGSGWTSVVTATLPAPAGGEDPGSSPLGSIQTLTDQLPSVSGSWGSGHLLRGTLFSVLVTDDGQVVAGAVAPERLYEALAAR